MVKLINKRTGSAFWVADERVEEYKAAGHKLAASPSAVQKPKEEPVEAKEEAKEAHVSTDGIYLDARDPKNLREIQRLIMGK